jgi:hypothetical protein
LYSQQNNLFAARLKAKPEAFPPVPAPTASAALAGELRLPCPSVILANSASGTLEAWFS